MNRAFNPDYARLNAAFYSDEESASTTSRPERGRDWSRDDDKRKGEDESVDSDESIESVDGDESVERGARDRGVRGAGKDLAAWSVGSVAHDDDVDVTDEDDESLRASDALIKYKMDYSEKEIGATRKFEVMRGVGIKCYLLVGMGDGVSIERMMRNTFERLKEVRNATAGG